MRPSPLGLGLGAALILVAFGGSTTTAQPADDAFSTTTRVISSHQIDRFEAIGQLQRSLRQEPDDRTGWVILGELAQEVALDVPASQVANYLAIARDAYEHALQHAPDDEGLQAALDFIRDQEAKLDAFHRDRDELIERYMLARRRELSRDGATPMLRVYATSPPITPRRAIGTGSASARGVIIDPGPAGATYYAPSLRPDLEDTQQPVTYDWFYQSFVPPTPRRSTPSNAVAGTPPTADVRRSAPADPAAIGSMPTTAPPAGSATAPPLPTAPRPR